MSGTQYRRDSLPIIHVRGTHYDIGFDIGRTFASLIQNYLKVSKELEETIPLYLTPGGKEIYEATLTTCKKVYPKYVAELQGTADGADVPFYKLFLLHMADIIPQLLKGKIRNEGQGCSTLIMNQGSEKIIAHTEDGLKEELNHTYLVKATITESEPYEEFTAYCYAGLLPGYAMGFNRYFAFSVNILGAQVSTFGGLPRTFVTRALFAAKSIDQIHEITKCSGVGVGDALSLNVVVFGRTADTCQMFNLEMGPSFPSSPIAETNLVEVTHGQNLFHCNKFLRLRIPEVDGPLVASSDSRHRTKDGLPEPQNMKQIVTLMGDCSASKYKIFRDDIDQPVMTLSFGVFNATERTWSLYMSNPQKSDPIVVLPLYSK